MPLYANDPDTPLQAAQTVYVRTNRGKSGTEVAFVFLLLLILLLLLLTTPRACFRPVAGAYRDLNKHLVTTWGGTRLCPESYAALKAHEWREP